MKLSYAESLANAEIKLWLNGIGGWTFKWNNRKTAFGVCSHHNKTIQLSKFLTESQPVGEVLDTIKHEIAHALAGSGEGHGRVWKRYCKMVGCNGKRSSKSVKAIDMGYTWAMIDSTGKIVKGYLRKPNRNTFMGVNQMYLNGRKAETLGTLQIVPFSNVVWGEV